MKILRLTALVVPLVLCCAALTAAPRKAGSEPARAPSRSVITYGDSVARGAVATSNFTTVVARALAMRPVTLAADGYDLDLVIDGELQETPHDGAIVLLYVGTDDVYPIARQQRSIVHFAHAYDSLVSSIHAICPSARIFAGTIVLSNRPPFFDRAIEAINYVIRAQPGVTIVELTADRRLYDKGSFVGDVTHANTRGHTFFAGDFLARIRGRSDAPKPVFSRPIAYLTPLQPRQHLDVREPGYRGSFHQQSPCTTREHAAVAHLETAPGGGGTFAIVGDGIGTCLLRVADARGGSAALPVSVYGPLVVQPAELSLRLGGPPRTITFSERGYQNNFGIDAPCTDSKNVPIAHWLKGTLNGPSVVQTVVADHLGSCLMHVYDSDAPTQAIDVPVTVHL